MIRILLIDDEPEVLNARAEYLLDQGCIIDTATDAANALICASRSTYDAILLDVVMPKKGGFDLCGELKLLSDSPIIFLSSMSDADHQLKGFSLGAADYITKDCPLPLFWAKVKTRIELSKGTAVVTLSYPPLQLDLQKHIATMNDTDLLLTATEFQLLVLMASKPMTIWSVEALYREIWGTNGNVDVQLVQTHLSRMRRKIEKASPLHDFLETVWGKGYQFVPMNDENFI